MTYSITPNSKLPAQPQNSEMSPMELALLGGDLSKLSEKDRSQYYAKLCDSLGLNPMTWPFEYIKFDGKLKLYAKKDATEQLRKLNKVSIAKADLKIENGLAIVEVLATTLDGRSDVDIGVVAISGLSGKELGNALMRAVTKGKRRATLSICGLGWLDETEIDSISAFTPPPSVNKAAFYQVIDTLNRLKWTDFQIQNCLTANFNKLSPTELTDDQLLDFIDYLVLFEQSTAEAKRLGWSKDYGQSVLLTQFGVETRNNLNAQQLKECLAFLKSQQPANPA